MTTSGAQLRAAREAAGVSLTWMASRTHFSKSHLSNIEGGRRTVTPDVVLAYERALGEDVERRGLLAGAAASVVAPAAVTELIHRGFAAALNGRSSVDEWQHRTAKTGIEYMSVGAGELQQRLAGDLVVLQQHLEGPQLWAVAGRLLTVYGKTTTDKAEAIRWYKLAGIAADRSDDTAVRVWVRGRAALALAYEGAAIPVAAEMARHALALDDRPSLGRLNALVAQAHVAGVRGDRATAIESLEQAKRVFDVAGASEQISDFAVPEWRFHTFTSMLLSRLGDPRAIEEQEAADKTRPTTLPRFATHIELHRGLMLAKAGDAPEGLAYARRALAKLPPERHSLSLRLMVAEIEHAAKT